MIKDTLKETVVVAAEPTGLRRFLPFASAPPPTHTQLKSLGYSDAVCKRALKAAGRDKDHLKTVRRQAIHYAHVEGKGQHPASDTAKPCSVCKENTERERIKREVEAEIEEDKRMAREQMRERLRHRRETYAVRKGRGYYDSSGAFAFYPGYTTYGTWGGDGGWGGDGSCGGDGGGGYGGGGDGGGCGGGDGGGGGGGGDGGS